MANKYGNQRIQHNGMIFDSAKEFQRWRELSLLQACGEIQDLQRQVEFVLIPAQRYPDTVGKRGGVRKGKIIENKCSYVADFVYTENGKKVVEDTKGFRTKDYIIKRKLMLYMHNIKIKEI